MSSTDKNLVDVVPTVVDVVPTVVDVVPTVVVPDMAVAVILVQVSKELVAFLAGGKLTLANVTSVTIDLYNFIQSYKSLTKSQKVRMLITVLTQFVHKELNSDQTLLLVIEHLVPSIVETAVGVSDGTINIGEVIEKDIKGCLSCFRGMCKK